MECRFWKTDWREDIDMSTKSLSWKLVLSFGILFCVVWFYFYAIAGGYQLFLPSASIQKWAAPNGSIYEVSEITREGNLYHYDRKLDKSFKVTSFTYFCSDHGCSKDHVAQVLSLIMDKHHPDALKQQGFQGIRVYTQPKFRWSGLLTGNLKRTYFIPLDEINSFIRNPQKN